MNIPKNKQTKKKQKVKSGPVSICHTHATKTNFNSLVNKEKQMKSTTKAFIPHQISNGKVMLPVSGGPPAPFRPHISPPPSPHFFIPFFLQLGVGNYVCQVLIFFWSQKSLT